MGFRRGRIYRTTTTVVVLPRLLDFCFPLAISQIQTPSVAQIGFTLKELLAAIRKAAIASDSSSSVLDADDRECINRWSGNSAPHKSTLFRVVKELWGLQPKGESKGSNKSGNSTGKNEGAPRHPVVRKAFEPFLLNLPLPQQNEEGFAHWCVDLLEKERARRAKDTRRKTDKERNLRLEILKRASKAKSPVSASAEVRKAVDKLIGSVGLTVLDECVVLDEERILPLGSLYEYVDRLQGTSRVPSYFRGVPDIPLDEIYVELSAAPDQRPLNLGGEATRDWTEEEPRYFDQVRRWKLAVEGTRLEIKDLLREAAVKPAVILGDPGAGKSTLTSYLLHAIGKEILGSPSLIPYQVLPFRVALRDFVLNGQQDDFSILRYIIRTQLRVDTEDVATWVSFLTHFETIGSPFRLLLLVDGIDEASPNRDTYGMVRDRLARFEQRALLVFTSRRAGFDPPVTRFGAYELLPLADHAIEAMIENWFRKVYEQPEEFVQAFITWVFGDSSTHEMAGNPCLLALLCYLNQDRWDGVFLRASCRAQLYELAVEKLREDASREGVAHPDTALELLSSFALARYTGDSERNRPTALFRKIQAINHLRTELGKSGDGGLTPLGIFDFWKGMRLVAQWDRGALHCFIHQSFQEYFAAWALVALPMETISQLLEVYRFNPYWREVWHFYSGFCRDHLPNGRARFEQLIKSVCFPPDEFGEVDWFAVTLCREYGLVNTSKLLGYDLRERLFDVLFVHHWRKAREYGQKIGEVASFHDSLLGKRVRMMVDLDPGCFLEWVKRTLDHATRESQWDLEVLEDQSRRAEVLFALLILNSIYHPGAIAYQVDLLKRESSMAGLTDRCPPLGPRFTLGPNKKLLFQLEMMDYGRLPKEFLRRVIGYLGDARNKRAGDCLARIADDVSPNSLEGFDILCCCLSAMSMCQDSRAVQLAIELWDHKALAENRFRIACMELARVGSPEAHAILTKWQPYLRMGQFSRDCLSQSPEDRRVTDRLNEWLDGSDSRGIFAFLDANMLSYSVAVSAWINDLPHRDPPVNRQLEGHLWKMASEPMLGENEWSVIACLIEPTTRMNVPRLELLTYLARQVPSCHLQAWRGIWGALIRLRIEDCRTPDSAEWLVSTAIPLIESEFNRCKSNDEEYPFSWIFGWFHCTLPVLSELAAMGLRTWKELPADVVGMLFDNLKAHPDLVPVPLAREFFMSPDSLWKVGLQLLLKTDPGFLMTWYKSRKDEQMSAKLSEDEKLKAMAKLSEVKKLRAGAKVSEIQEFTAKLLEFEELVSNANLHEVEDLLARSEVFGGEELRAKLSNFVELRAKLFKVEELLLESSCDTGILFFKDQLYSPSKARFVPYSGQA